MLEIDHVFVCVDDPELAQRALLDFDMKFGARRIHRGQGTANVCAFFDNAYLELMWRHNDMDLQSEVVAPLGLWERLRWRETGASPFGIAFRPEDGEVGLESWPYEAPFLPEGAALPIVTPRFLWREPLALLSLASRPPVQWPPERRPPLNQHGRHRKLSGVAICGPGVSRYSDELQNLVRLGVLTLRQAAEDYLELTWDDASGGESMDFRPAIPLVVRW